MIPNASMWYLIIIRQISWKPGRMKTHRQLESNAVYLVCYTGYKFVTTAWTDSVTMSLQSGYSSVVEATKLIE